MPGLDPGPGERRVVDQAGIGKAPEHGFGGCGWHAAAAERGGELDPRRGRGGQYLQADLPGPLFGSPPVVWDGELADGDPEACQPTFRVPARFPVTP